MPELPEVETIKSSLQSNVGVRIVRVELRREDIVRQKDFAIGEIEGQTITALERRAKFLDFSLADGRHLVLHMGMSGRIYQAPADQVPAEKHIHLLLFLNNGRCLVYQDPRRFGGVWLLDKTERLFSRLGVEPLTAAFTPAYLSRAVKGRKIAIKSLLLDQRLISGIGNIYADEALFAAGIRPQRPAGSLNEEELKALVRAVKKVLRQGIRQRGTTFRDFRDGDNRVGTFQNYLQVYGRGEEPCRHCGQPLQVERVGGRSAHFCPHCQK